MPRRCSCSTPPSPMPAGWAGASRWRYRSLYLTQGALDQVAAAWASSSVPYFTRNMFRERDLIEGFLAVHRAIEQGHDVFRGA